MRNKTDCLFSLKSFVKVVGPIIASAFLCLSAFAQDEVPTLKMSGDVALLTNYIEKGLTQTNQDPSLQGNFSFNFGPQFKMGVFASNVDYNSTEHFLMRLNAELKVVISTSADFKLGYFDNVYFRTHTRDGSTTYLEITVQGFRIHYESNSDWEGTQSRSSYYAFGKTFDLNSNWKWDNQVGYSMLKATGYSDYFDIRTTFIYKGSNNINYEVGGTATSAPTQFAGAGNVMGFAGATTSF